MFQCIWTHLRLNYLDINSLQMSDISFKLKCELKSKNIIQENKNTKTRWQTWHCFLFLNTVHLNYDVIILLSCIILYFNSKISWYRTKFMKLLINFQTNPREVVFSFASVSIRGYLCQQTLLSLTALSVWGHLPQLIGLSALWHRRVEPRDIAACQDSCPLVSVTCL